MQFLFVQQERYDEITGGQVFVWNVFLLVRLLFSVIVLSNFDEKLNI